MALKRVENLWGQKIEIEVDENPDEIGTDIIWERGVIHPKTGKEIEKSTRMRTNYIKIYEKGINIKTTNMKYGGVLLVFYDKNFKYEGVYPTQGSGAAVFKTGDINI